MKATKNYMVWKMTNKFQYFHMASRMEKDDGCIRILNIVQRTQSYIVRLNIMFLGKITHKITKNPWRGNKTKINFLKLVWTPAAEALASDLNASDGMDLDLEWVPSSPPAF